MGVVYKKRVRSWKDKHAEGKKERESKKQKQRGRYAEKSAKNSQKR